MPRRLRAALRLQLTRPVAPGMSAQHSPRTVEDIYEDFELRRNGLLTALTTGGMDARFSGVERSAQANAAG